MKHNGTSMETITMHRPKYAFATIAVILMVTAFLTLGLTTISGQTTAASSSDWTQDSHDAQRTSYTAEEPVLPWRFLWSWNGPDANGGAGGHFYNAPPEARTITGGANIYVPAGANGLYALNKRSGQQVWNVTAATFNATPAYDPTSGFLFAGGSNGQLLKINSTSGAISATYNAGSPLNKAVLLVGSFAYVVSDNGQLHKVNTSTMTAAWVYAGNAPIATPPSYSASRDAIIFATNDLFVHAVNNATGVARWRVKPTSNAAGFPNEMDGMWPVIAEKHGIVFIRMRLDHNAGLWGGSGTGGMYPNTNAETRAYLQSKPQLKNLFALSLDTGAEAFIPAVGYGGVEALVNAQAYLDIGPVPVIRVLADGSEVAYMNFRNGQSNPPDGRWDTHMGEMVLDNTTIPGMVAGDLRFISWANSSMRVTDEQTPFTMAGSSLLRAHWGASESVKILDRSNTLGLTYAAPITTQANPTIIRRQTTCSNFVPSTHWTTCGLTLMNDGRFWPGPGFWVYWNVMDPPTPIRSAYSEGLLPRHTYVSDGLIIVEGNGGELFVLAHSGTVSSPTPTAVSTTPAPTAAPTIIPSVTPLPVTPTTGNGTPTVTSMSASNTQIPRYQRFELTFQISKSYPLTSWLPYYYYDPSDPAGVEGITIDAHLRAPSGREVIAPAFYYQDYIRTGITQVVMTPTTSTNWKVRFSPDEVGEYSYYITIVDKNGSSRYPATGDMRFTSVSSTSKGFIRISPRDPRFLEYANGESFVPITSGRQWWSPASALRSLEYEQTFAEFGKYGINLTRIWDQNDGYGLTVEGHYDAYQWPDDFNPEQRVDVNTIPKGTQMNQRGGYEMDKIIEGAERNGVYIQLTAHGDPYWIWDATINGTAPVAWDNPARIRYWQRNFRYRVARWGYSTSILAWEHWNELGHIALTSDVYRFYQSYGQFQQQTDPYHHLRTTSQGSQTWSPAFWSSPVVDIANYHDYMMISRYSADLTYDAANFVARFAQCLRTTNVQSCGLGLGDGSSWQGNPRPIIWGELDTGTTQWNEANPQPKATHDMRWAGLFSPIGMAPIDWYFSAQSAEFIATKHKEAKIAADYFRGLDYAGKAFTYLSTSDVNLTNEIVTSSNAQLRVLAMRARSGNELYAWVQNKANARWDQTALSPAISASFTAGGMTAGVYRVEIWDTLTGLVSDGGTATASTSGTLTININNLSRDVALKILPLSAPNVTATPIPPTATFAPTITPSATPTRIPTLVPTVTPSATQTALAPTATLIPATPTPQPTQVVIVPSPTATSTETLLPPTSPAATIPPPLTNEASLHFEVTSGANTIGGTIAVNLMVVNVANVFGMDMTCTVNPVVLLGVNTTDADGFNASNSFIIDRGYQADGSWRIAASRLKPASAIAGNTLIITLNYLIINNGSSDINCNIVAVNSEGRDVPLTVIPTTIALGDMSSLTLTPLNALTIEPTSVVPTETPIPTVQPTETPIPIAGSVYGIVRYPGINEHSGITVVLFKDGALFTQTITDAAGAYQFNQLQAGGYVAAMGAPLSLVIQHPITVIDGQPITIPDFQLTMGDTDSNGQIDLNDAALIGANLNLSSQLVPMADLNHDGMIDIRDLVLVGSGFGLISPLVYP